MLSFKVLRYVLMMKTLTLHTLLMNFQIT